MVSSGVNTGVEKATGLDLSEFIGSLLSMKCSCVLWLWMFLSECKTSTTDGIFIQGFVGRNIIITCSHKWASNNMKYFCRDPCGDGDILVQTEQSPRGRYALKDYGTGTFAVTIADLQEADSGIYWCGVKRSVANTFNEVKLTVCKDNTWSLDEAPRPQATEKLTNEEKHWTTPSHSLSISTATKESTQMATEHVYYISYAAAGLAVLVIMCAVVPTVVCLCRKSRGVAAAPAHIEQHSGEASGVYENASYDRPYATIRKTRNRSTDNSQSDGIYQNVLIDTNQAEPVYGNLY